MMDKIQIKDYTKPNYVIMRKIPDGREVVISGTFTIKENAIKECKKRIEYCRETNDIGNGWGEPYLVEINLQLNKINLK